MALRNLAALELVVERERARWAVPAVALGVLAEGRIEGLGAGADAGTRFRIASLTKPFVATLALVLAEAGRLSLDAPIGEVLPDLPVPHPNRAASIRMLLGHRGGLACELDRPLPTDDDDGALERVLARGPLRAWAPPARTWSYANVGFWLVGLACARAEGTTFEEAMRRRVLEPLALHDTGFDDPGVPGHVPVAPGAEAVQPLESRYPRVRRPSGGLISTVGDLLAFARHHLGGAGPASAAGAAALREPQDGRAATGWFVDRRRDGTPIVSHHGSAAGYTSRLVLVPEARAAIAVLTNSARGSAAIGAIVDATLDRVLGLRPEPPAWRTLPAPRLEALAGRYRGPDLEAEVTPRDGGIELRARSIDPFTGEEETPLPLWARPVSPTSFVVPGGERAGDRFEFPLPGLLRASVVAERSA